MKSTIHHKDTKGFLGALVVKDFNLSKYTTRKRESTIHFAGTLPVERQTKTVSRMEDFAPLM
jgi:hypothetical protein